MYLVLKEVWRKTAEHCHESSGYYWAVVGFTELGTADSMEDANIKFPRGRKNGYSLVLQEIPNIH